ncbi:MAG TPA: VWA domain-containing protein [Pyrinomonadaceae bacterium]|nr:VWA domain-containing protein [Pyrinomonadaceae bacterium]
MTAEVIRFCLVCLICIVALATAPDVASQRRSRAPQKRTTPKPLPTPTPSTLEVLPDTSPEATPEPTPPDEHPVEQQEVLKITTDLITVPVVANTGSGTYVPDLRQEEFSISEDGVKQEVAFFATVSSPFHVVLVLDTSASTQEKLGMIRRAAIAFVEQLQPGDRVKVISFDDQVRDLNDFTTDRAAVRNAINRTESGRGTKLYDAIDMALASMGRVQGRKAMVLFSDGVDFHSDRATFDGTLHFLEEEGAIVYPIRYETRAETEQLAREQAGDISPQLPTISVIRAPPSGTTAPTFPSDEPDSVPTSGGRGTTGPLGLPLPGEILRRRRESERDRENDRHKTPTGLPPLPDSDPSKSRTEPPTSTRRGSTRTDDSIDAMLDQLYLKADSYLNDLANKSGGRLVRADNLSSLPDAFAKIAAELRTQYAVGYYPTNKERDGKYRKIKVTSSRKDVIIRARPGYRAPIGG